MEDRAATGQPGRSARAIAMRIRWRLPGLQRSSAASAPAANASQVRAREAVGRATPAMCREDEHASSTVRGAPAGCAWGGPEYTFAWTLHTPTGMPTAKMPTTRICRDRGVTEAQVEARVPVHEIKDPANLRSIWGRSASPNLGRTGQPVRAGS